MCNQVITQYPQCGHQDSDTFPCDPLLDTGTCPGPTTTPKILTRDENTPCHACAETQHLKAALLRIEQDASLAPVSSRSRIRSNHGNDNGNGPNTAQPTTHYLQTREFFPRCGHGARYQWTDFEADDPRHRYMDTEIPFLVCYGCESAGLEAVAALQARGRWEGNDDPWGEKAKVAGGVGGSGTAAGAGAGTDAGVSAPVPAPVYAPPTPAPSGPVSGPDPADDDDLYGSSAQRSFYHDDDDDDDASGSGSGSEEGDGEYDTSAAKNKGVRGRPARYPSPRRRSRRRRRHRRDERAGYSSDEEDDEDDDDDDRNRNCR
ncbi:MAG: hypothetical protein Q9187_007485, partial [Circinaria calcarea]